MRNASYKKMTQSTFHISLNMTSVCLWLTVSQIQKRWPTKSTSFCKFSLDSQFLCRCCSSFELISVSCSIKPSVIIPETVRQGQRWSLQVFVMDIQKTGSLLQSLRRRKLQEHCYISLYLRFTTYKCACQLHVAPASWESLSLPLVSQTQAFQL